MDTYNDTIRCTLCLQEIKIINGILETHNFPFGGINKECFSSGMDAKKYWRGFRSAINEVLGEDLNEEGC